jgi:hypothetical protein
MIGIRLIAAGAKIAGRCHARTSNKKAIFTGINRQDFRNRSNFKTRVIRKTNVAMPATYKFHHQQMAMDDVCFFPSTAFNALAA